MNDKYSKRISLTGFIFFAIMAILSILYYKERLLTVDSAYYTFKLLQFEKFNIEHGRYGSYLTQWLPLIFIKLGASLKWVMIVYSFSFILFYYLIFLFVVKILRSTSAGVVLMLTTCLAIRDSFYSPVSEFPQGMAFSVIFFALCERTVLNYTGIKKWLYYVCMIATIVVVSYFHLLLGLALIFIPLYFIFLQRRYKDTFLWSAIGITLLLFCMKVLFVPAGSYQGSKIPGIEEFKIYLPELWELPSRKFFTDFAKKHYQFVLLLLLASNLYLLIRKRDILTPLFNTLTVCGFLVLVLITYHEGETTIMYENYFMLLGLFAAVMFVTTLYGAMREKFRTYILALILLVNLYQIWDRNYTYTERVKYIDRITHYGYENYHAKKFILDQANIPWDFVAVRWAFPFETILYTSLNAADSSVSVFPARNVSDYIEYTGKDSVFLGADWGLHDYRSSELNKKYFNIGEGKYVLLGSSQCDSAFLSSIHSGNISIQSAPSAIVYMNNDFMMIPVTIENRSGVKINSVPCDKKYLHLSYHVFDPFGKPITFDGRRTRLEVDISESYHQYLYLDPLPKGKYKLVIDLVEENKRWFGINQTIDILVK